MVKQYEYNNIIFEIDDTKKLYKKNIYRDIKGYTLRYEDDGRMYEEDIYDYHDVLIAFYCECIEECERCYGTLARQICYDLDLTVNGLYTPSEYKALDIYHNAIYDIYVQALDDMYYYMFHFAPYKDEERMQKCKKIAINKFVETLNLLYTIIKQCESEEE